MYRLLRNEAGVALLAAVLAMGVLGFFGATFASLVVQHQYAAVNQTAALQALYLAEAGFELAVQELIDNADKAFNGVAGDGEIGRITNVPIGSGTVSVTKGSQTPPVFTATGTVGDIRRVITMTIDARNLVTQDPVFNDAANLATNWPQTLAGDNAGGSGIESNALKSWTNAGTDREFIAYREQTLSPTVAAGQRIAVVRLNYMRDRIGVVSDVRFQTLALHLVKSDGTTDTVWSVGSAEFDAVSDADKGVWKVADIRGWATSPTLATQKVRLFYRLHTSATAVPPDQAFGWFDNIEVLLVKKSAWGEP